MIPSSGNQLSSQELAKWIHLDDTYKKKRLLLVAGYEDNQPENIHMQLILEEEMKWVLDNRTPKVSFSVKIESHSTFGVTIVNMYFVCGTLMNGP
jgi:hypothetical protein